MTIKTGIYIHFKGGKYLVTGMATHTETGEDLVLYESLEQGSERKVYARPLVMFQDIVKHEGKVAPRFKRMR